MTKYIPSNLLPTKLELNLELLDYDLHSIYCKYHYCCMQHNYKTLDLHDFSIHIKFIWNKLYTIIQKLKYLANYSYTHTLQSLENKISRYTYLIHNPNYEIEFISPSLSEIEQQLNELYNIDNKITDKDKAISNNFNSNKLSNF